MAHGSVMAMPWYHGSAMAELWQCYGLQALRRPAGRRGPVPAAAYTRGRVGIWQSHLAQLRAYCAFPCRCRRVDISHLQSGNFREYSWKFQEFRGILWNSLRKVPGIPGTFLENSGKFRSPEFPEIHRKFPGTIPGIPGTFPEFPEFLGIPRDSWK